MSDWESINVMGNDERKEVTTRLSVPGGWLYRYVTIVNLREVELATMCFVPHTTTLGLDRQRLKWAAAMEELPE